jgi:hypothetical protein
MIILVHKDSNMIHDFGDQGETALELQAAGRYDPDYQDVVDATPTWPANPATWRAAWGNLIKCWLWDSDITSFYEAPAANVGQPYTHGQATKTQMLAIVSPSVGDTVYCTTYGRSFWWTGNTWQCDQTVEGKNNSGSTVYEGDCLIPSASLADGYVTTATDQHPSIVGTTVIGGAQGAYITIATSGVWLQFVNGDISVGEHLVSGYGNGNAIGMGGPPASVSGQFATAKEAVNTADVELIKVQLGIMAHY